MLRLNEYFITLDIETSTEYEDVIKDGVITKKPVAVWLSYGFSILWDKFGKPIHGCYFRDWIKLQKFYDRVSSKFYYYEIICYVHNLGYEFDFLMKNLSYPDKFLSNSTHNVIAGTLKRYKNIEFRCTYMLSSYSLKKIGDMVQLPKLESEYRTIYPGDKITNEEIKYCYRDNEIVAKYIVDVMLKEYGTIHNIPYTKTGRVRKLFKERYSQYKNDGWDLMPPPDCYEALNKAFNGGITISNPMFTNLNLFNVHSYDITSSYPFTMLSEEFPQKIKRIYELPDKLDSGKWFIAKIELKNISSKYMWQWLSISKMENVPFDCEFFNGKLIRGTSCERFVTNVDFELIKMTYCFDYKVLEYYELTDIKPLPQCFFDTILNYAEKKHELKEKLKNVEEGSDEYYECSNEYTKAKNDFNSIYGMMVEKLVKPIYEIDENYIWTKRDSEYKYNNKTHLKRNFLFGVFITAYARRNLITAIVKNCPDTFVYADTDSIKFIGENNFIDTNKQLPDEFLKIECIKKLGRFDYEGTYKQFKTLGAKKYCYSHEYSDNKIAYTLTVAGLPKNDNYGIHSLDDFKIGKKFENCKLGKKYITNTCYIEVDDSYNIIVEKSEKIQDFFDSHNIDSSGGIGLYPTSYILDMTDTDLYYCNLYQRGILKWAEAHKRQTGIDLTEYFHLNVHIT